MGEQLLMKVEQLSPGPWIKEHDRDQGRVKHCPAFPSGDRGTKASNVLPRAGWAVRLSRGEDANSHFSYKRPKCSQCHPAGFPKKRSAGATAAPSAHLSASQTQAGGSEPLAISKAWMVGRQDGKDLKGWIQSPKHGVWCPFWHCHPLTSCHFRKMQVSHCLVSASSLQRSQGPLDIYKYAATNMPTSHAFNEKQHQAKQRDPSTSPDGRAVLLGQEAAQGPISLHNFRHSTSCPAGKCLGYWGDRYKDVEGLRVIWYCMRPQGHGKDPNFSREVEEHSKKLEVLWRCLGRFSEDQKLCRLQKAAWEPG